LKIKHKPEDIYDNWELFKPLVFAAVITWIPFSIFEIYIPYVEKEVRYQVTCEAKGGFVYQRQNEEKRCIKKDYIII
jgi:hypothetical protein